MKYAALEMKVMMIGTTMSEMTTKMNKMKRKRRKMMKTKSNLATAAGGREMAS